MLKLNLNRRNYKTNTNGDSKDGNDSLDINLYESKNYGREIPAEEANYARGRKPQSSQSAQSTPQLAMLDEDLRKEENFFPKNAEELEIELKAYVAELNGEIRENKKQFRANIELKADELGLDGEAREQFVAQFVNGKGLQEYLEENVIKQLEDVTSDKAQREFLAVAIYTHAADLLQLHIERVFPVEFLEGIDDRIESGELSAEAVMGLFEVLHRKVASESLLGYCNRLVQELIPQFKEMFADASANFAAAAKLSEEDQQKFLGYMEAENYDLARELLSKAK